MSEPRSAKAGWYKIGYCSDKHSNVIDILKMEDEAFRDYFNIQSDLEYHDPRYFNHTIYFGKGAFQFWESDGGKRNAVIHPTAKEAITACIKYHEYSDIVFTHPDFEEYEVPGQAVNYMQVVGPMPAPLSQSQQLEQIQKAIQSQIQGIGDVNSTAKGSGARYNNGKPDLSLVPLWAFDDCARVFEYGKKKYAAWNWAKGMPWSVPLACALRHLGAIQRGEVDDPESNLPHLGHVMCNIVMLAHYAKYYPEGNDLMSADYATETSTK